MAVPYSDFKHQINQYFNYLYLARRLEQCGLCTSSTLTNRSWETTSRLTGGVGRIKLSYVMPTCIGQTHSTHSYKLKRDQAPRCEHCRYNYDMPLYFGGVQFFIFYFFVFLRIHVLFLSKLFSYTEYHDHDYDLSKSRLCLMLNVSNGII